MAKWMLRCAVVYALMGIAMGIGMAASGDFLNKGVHVHLNLVGWVSMAVMALAYQAFPAMAHSRLATAQFCLHNLGLPAMAYGIYALLHHLPLAEPVVGTGSMMVALAFLAFAVNVWRHAGEAEARPAAAAATGLNRPLAASVVG
ncbi:MAG: cytochrome-c oxidase [Acidobacteriota bacterium]